MASVTTTTTGCVNKLLSSFTGLDHLEGEWVSILADGVTQSQVTVSSGAVTLASSYSVVKVGLPYYSDFETLNIDFKSMYGTIQGAKKKVGNTIFRLIDSRGGWVGPDFDNMYEAFTETELELSSGSSLANTALYTGDIRMPLNSSYNNGGRICYRQIEPLPITISAVIPEIASGGPAR